MTEHYGSVEGMREDARRSLETLRSDRLAMGPEDEYDAHVRPSVRLFLDNLSELETCLVYLSAQPNEIADLAGRIDQLQRCRAVANRIADLYARVGEICAVIADLLKEDAAATDEKALQTQVTESTQSATTEESS